MTVFQERLPNDYASLVRRIEALERDLQQARAARRLEAATIGRGGVTVKGGAIVLQDASGNEIARMGIREDLSPGPGGVPQPGFILRRSDGSVAFTLDDPDGGSPLFQILKMQDASGNIIFSEDAASKWGLATPTFNIPLHMFGPDVNAWPGTTGTNFFTAWGNTAAVWNPMLDVSAVAIMTAGSGSTGQVRLSVNGVAQDAFATNTGSQTNASWTVDLTTISGVTPGSSVSIAIETCRTGATAGKCVAVPVYCRTRGR